MAARFEVWLAVIVGVSGAMTGCTGENPAFNRNGGAGSGGGTDVPDLEPPAPEQECATDWWDESFTQRVRLAARNGRLSVPIDDFVAKVELTSDVIDLSAMDPQGRDLRFIDPDCSRLDYELVSADDTGFVAWVSIPQIQPRGNPDFIWVYWGAPDRQSRSNPEDVWRRFEGVWHFEEDVQERVLDSTRRGRDGQATGTDVDAGAVGRSRRFFPNEPHYIDISNSDNLFTGWDEFTVSLWVYPDYPDDASWDEGEPDGIIRKSGGTVYGRTWREDWLEAGHGHFQIDFIFEDAEGLYRRITVPRNEWSLVVYHYDGRNYEQYLNGELYDRTEIGGDDVVSEQRTLRLGDEENPMDGKIDELMISRDGRSSDWAKAQHASMTGELWRMDELQSQ